MTRTKPPRKPRMPTQKILREFLAGASVRELTWAHGIKFDFNDSCKQHQLQIEAVLRRAMIRQDRDRKGKR